MIRSSSLIERPVAGFVQRIIGVANQTADVQISGKTLRRIATLHSLIAFVFNTVILALAVNLAVTLL